MAPRFSGDLILHLFEDLAPTTTARIEDLVNQGYYNGLDFFRVFDGFMSQGGRKSSDPSTEQLDDELNSSLTFTSRGLLAMANAGDDTSTAEFFITAIDAAGSTNPIGVAAMPQFLNFDFTIFGQLVSGFDLFQQIMSTPTQDQTVAGQPEHSDPLATITITSRRSSPTRRTRSSRLRRRPVLPAPPTLRSRPTVAAAQRRIDPLLPRPSPIPTHPRTRL